MEAVANCSRVAEKFPRKIPDCDCATRDSRTEVCRHFFDDTRGIELRRKFVRDINGRDVEIAISALAAIREKIIFGILFGVPIGNQIGMVDEQIVMRLNVAQAEAAVADARNYFSPIVSVHARPRCTDVVVAEPTKIFRRVIENERVELIKQYVVEVRERLVKVGRQHQSAVRRHALEMLRRELCDEFIWRDV